VWPSNEGNLRELLWFVLRKAIARVNFSGT
jgi:hypothetical protein